MTDLDSRRPLTVGELMTRHADQLPPDSTLGMAAALMAGSRISSVIICEGERIRGIVTERDVLHAMRQRRAQDSPIHRIMSHPVLSVPESLDYRSAYQIAARHAVRHLVVVDEEGFPQGVVTETDFRHHLGLDFFRQMRNVEALMERRFPTLPPAAPLDAALDLMESQRSSCLVVVEGERPVGIVTERDVVRLYLARGEGPSPCLAEIMTSPVSTIAADAPLAEAATRMMRARFRHLAVVDDQGRLVGLLSEHDMMRPLEVDVVDEALAHRVNLVKERDSALERLRLVLEATHDGIWDQFLETEDGAAQGYCSPRFHEILGWDLGAPRITIGEWHRLIHPEDRPGVIARYEASLAPGGAPYLAEYRIRHREGHWLWVEARGQVVERDSQGQARRRVGTLSDISRRKETEQTLRTRERYERALLDNFPFLVWLKDRDSRFMAVNRAFAAACGFASPEMLTGKPEAEVVPAHRARLYVADDRRVMEGRCQISTEEVIEGPDGTHWFETCKAPVIDTDGTLFGTVGFSRDISDRKIREGELDAERSLLRTLYGAIPDPVWLKDQTGRYLACNAAFCAYYGRSEADILGREDEDFLPLAEARLYRQQDIAALDATAPITSEQWLNYADGRRLLAEVSKTPVRNSVGKPIGVLGIARDVTGRKRAEERVRLRGQALAALIRGASIDEVLSAIALSAEAEMPDWLCAIMLVDDGGRHLHLGAAPNLPESFRAAMHGIPVAEGLGCCGAAAKTGQPVIVSDLRQHTRGSPYEALVHQANLGACWSQPILGIQGKILGTFAVYHHAPASPTERDRVVLADTAQLASLVLGHLGHQRALENSHATFRGIFDSIQEALYILDQEGRFVDVNEGTLRLDGYPREQLIGATPKLLEAEGMNDDAALNAHLTAAFQGEPQCFEFWSKDAGGRIYPKEVRLYRGSYFGQAAIIAIAQDISERVRAAERQRLAASVFDNAHEGIVITDPEGVILEINQTFTALTGFSREEALGARPNLLKSGLQPPAFYEEMWRAIREEGHWRGEVWNRKKGGEVYVEALTISAVRTPDGRISQFVGIFSDVTLLKEHQERLERMAHYDALTQLPNRILLADRLQLALAQMERSRRLLAVCYLDLDGFKPINDELGHETGDHLLIEVAKRLKSGIRTGDTVARLGGDEFVLLLTDIEDIHECDRAVDRIIANLASPFQVAGHSISISASIGVTLYPNDLADPDALLRHADQAMYAAKQAGRNRFHLFDPEHDRSLRVRREALTRLEEGLERGEFELFYQPKVDMRRGQVIGAEALIRWNHPERGRLPPGDFLPVIGDNDFAVTLGEWVIATALDQLSAWRQAGIDLVVSINIAGRHLQAPDFALRLEEMLLAHPHLPAGCLELEVLETTALDDIQYVSEIISQCQQMGVSFALDDFGTGYSSLTYFKRLPADILKIDQSFIRDMLEDPEDMAIVEGVIGLTQAFRRKVIAEGVETPEHGLMLLHLGCDLAQGYGIARPMPAGDFPGWVSAFQPDPLWRWLGQHSCAREDLPLLMARTEHRRWAERILETGHLPQESAPAGAIGDNCRLGQWLTGPGRARCGSWPGFQRLDALHRSCHDLAQALGNPHVRVEAEDFQASVDALDEALQTLIVEALPRVASAPEGA